MSKTLRTDIILTLFNLINKAKYGKLSDEDKIKIWKVQRALKPHASKFEEDINSLKETLFTESFKDRLKEASQIEEEAKKELNDTDNNQLESEFVKTLMNKNKKYAEFQAERSRLMESLNDGLKEFASKEVEIEFEPLREDAFGKLMSSNDWTLEQASFISDYICE